MGKGGESSTDQLNGATSWTARTLKPVEKLEAREDFIWDTTDEPHASRRKEIMKAHPEVKKLFGHEWKSKYLCMFLLIIPQIWLSWYTTDFGWPAYLFVAYVFGATITQSLFLAIHELAHNLFFQGTQANRLFAMVANWPIGIAYCVPFRGYHLEHHKWQGVDGIDTDIPSRFEGKYVRGPVLKAVWCCCQILTYALRPMFIKAQDFTPNHLYNWISQIGFDLVVYYFWGYKVTLTPPTLPLSPSHPPSLSPLNLALTPTRAFTLQPLAYFVLCIFLAGGIHPCAGHFISEHYVFPHLDATQETYSYYGPLNWLTWRSMLQLRPWAVPQLATPAAWDARPRAPESIRP